MSSITKEAAGAGTPTAPKIIPTTIDTEGTGPLRQSPAEVLPPIADEIRADAIADLRANPNPHTFRIALRSGVDRDLAHLVVMGTGVNLGADLELYGDGFCRTLRDRVDVDELRIDEALELAAATAQAAGLDFDDACAVALMWLIRPASADSAVSNELRLTLAAGMFERGWNA